MTEGMTTAAGEAGQKLETRRADDGLRVVLSGRGCLDQALPSRELVERELSAVVCRLTFDATALGAWDSGLLTFLAGVIKAGAERGIEADQSELPKGIRRLLAMAFAAQALRQLAELLEQQPDAILRGKRKVENP